MFDSVTRLRIVILGYIVRMPLGGLSWHYLQYVRGLAQLGHDVYYIEDSCFFEDKEYAYSYDPTRNSHNDPSYGLRYSTEVFNRFGLGDRWAYYDAGSCTWHGPCADQIISVVRETDLLVNVGGVNPVRDWLMDIPFRVLVDTDPVFTQIRQLANPINRNLALQHNAFFTFGENIAANRSSVPDSMVPWQGTRQPITLDSWVAIPGPIEGRFTTVGAWDSYEAVEYNGIRYGMKSDSITPYYELPEKAREIFEIGLFDPACPPAFLRLRGWSVRDARELTRDPWIYQQYIQESKAEFSVAKEGYVVTRSGWFSERSAVYLASGRPVVLQDTGFSDWLETGAGVIRFNTPEEALEGVQEINNRYSFHCQAAREVAQEYFDSAKVLSSLIERAIT